MQGSDISLGDFIGSNAVDREVADLGMRLAWPVLQKARLGKFERTAELRLDVEAFREGIETATGLKPTSIHLLMQANVFAAKSGETRYGDLVDFNDSLGIKLLNANWKRIKELLVARYGYGNYDAFHDGLWTAIRRDVARPLRFQFWDDPGETPISSAGEALATSLYYLLAPAALGDRQLVERMGGLIKLVAKAIPIGEIKNKPGAWLVVAPSE